MKKFKVLLVELKDVITNVAGGLFVIAGLIVMAAESGFIPNNELVLSAKAVGLVCAGVVAYLTGKKPTLNV